MTPRTLFTIILKLFGLYFIRDIFVSIPQLLSVILYFKSGQNLDAIWILISSATTLAIEVSVCYYLIFKTEWVIKKLRLTDGFDEEMIPLNMHRATIIYIVVIIIGGLILIDEIPNLCRRVFNYIQQKRMGYNPDHTEAPFIVLSVVKIILAVLILTERRRIVSLILRKTNPETETVKTEE